MLFRSSRRDEAMAGLNLAAAYLKLDDALGAIRAAAASLEILHDLHDLSNQARTLSNLGAGLLRAGRPKAGRRCLEQARSLGRRARLEGDFFREIEALLPESAESEPEETDGIQWLRPVLQELLAG